MSVSPAKTRSLSGARVLLVGASGGIGRPLASALADRGAHLAVAGRDRSRLSDLGVGERFTFAFDLADEAAAQPLLGAAAGALGGLASITDTPRGRTSRASARTPAEMPAFAAE